MAKHDKKEIYPTFKVNPKDDDENAVRFTDDVLGLVEKVAPADTKHGDKFVMTISTKEEGMFNVFLNQQSINNLVDAYGEDDKDWLGNNVKLSLEHNDKFDSDMIVVSKAD